MPTDDSLDLAELNRLERRAAEEDQRGDNIFARRQLDGICRSQLRPLLNLVDRMGEALEAIPRQMRRPKLSRLLADYQRAKGKA